VTDARFDDCVRRLFAGTTTPIWRVGAEVELLALCRQTQRPVGVQGGHHASLLGMLRVIAAERRWQQTESPYGVPGFVLPGVGVLSFEPGGQLELSTRPFSSPSRLLMAVRGVIAALRGHAARIGLEILEIGLDPVNDVSAIPLAFPVERYTRMAAYFESLGGDGVRMMKQTASFQVSLDASPQDACDLWTALNGVTPFCIAAFANSPYVAGEVTRDASARARVWQRTDVARTGIFHDSADPAAEYREFALRAPAFSLDCNAAPLSDHFRTGTVAEFLWRRHLTTLFPEVRPRGHLEFRACDAVGDDARAALLVLLCAMARDRGARAAIAEITGAPDQSLYSAAPAAPAALVRGAAEALRVALASARAEPQGFWDRDDIARAEGFLQEYTSRGLTPASDRRTPLQLTA
jgi:glutamate--cysteine ligase